MTQTPPHTRGEQFPGRARLVGSTADAADRSTCYAVEGAETVRERLASTVALVLVFPPPPTVVTVSVTLTLNLARLGAPRLRHCAREEAGPTQREPA